MMQGYGYLIVKPYGLISLMTLQDILRREYSYIKSISREEVFRKSLMFAIKKSLHRASVLTIAHTNKKLVGYCLETNDYVFYIAYTGGYYSLGKKDYVTEYRVEREVVLTKTAKGNTNLLINSNGSSYYYNVSTKRIIDERQKSFKHEEVSRMPLESKVIHCQLPNNIVRFETVDEFVDWLLSEYRQIV